MKNSPQFSTKDSGTEKLEIKLHFEHDIGFLSSPPAFEPVLYKGFCVYYDSEAVVIFDTQNGRIIYRVIFKDIQKLVVYANYLLICVSEVYMVNLEKMYAEYAHFLETEGERTQLHIKRDFQIANILRMSKSLIQSLIIYPNSYISNEGVDFYGVAKHNSRITFYRYGRSILDCYSSGGEIHLIAGENIIGYYDDSHLHLYDIQGNEVLCSDIEEWEHKIVGAFFYEKQMYLVMDSRLIYACDTTSESLKLEEVGSLYGSNFYSVSLFGTKVYAAGVQACVVYDLVFGKSKRIFVDELVHEYSGFYDNNDDEKYESEKKRIRQDEDGDEAKGDDEIRYISPNHIWYNNTVIVMDSDEHVNKIFMFNNDIVDSTSYCSEIIVGGISGWLKWSSFDGVNKPGEYIFSGFMIKAHDGVITGICRHGDVLATGSKDRSVKLWRIYRGISLQIKEFIGVLEVESEVTSLSIDEECICAGTFDGSMSLFRYNTDGIEEYLRQSAHKKEISGMKITENMIVTASTDKTARFFSKSGVLLKKVEGERYNCVAADSELIAIGSNKGIRVFNGNTLQQVQYMLTKKPVLVCIFYKGYLLAVTDVIRIYDIQRGVCVKSYDFGVRGCWSADIPFLCGENKVLRLSDVSDREYARETEAKMKEHEDKILLERYSLEGNVLEEIRILMSKDDHRKTFRAIYKGYYNLNTLSFMEMFQNKGDRLLEIMKSSPGIKYTEVFNLLLNEHIKGTESSYEEFLKICKRHYENIEVMYSRLLALRYFP